MTPSSGGAPVDPLGRFPGNVPNPKPSAPVVRVGGEGLVVRFSPIKGVTPRRVLNRKIYLPVVMDAWSLDEEATHNEYDTISMGQFSQAEAGDARARQLRSTSMNTLTMDFEAPWLIATGQDPADLRTYLQQILRSKKPVHMLVTLSPHPLPRPELDMLVTLRRLTRELRPGERDTRYMSIDFKEWRDSSVRRRQHEAPGSSRKRGVKLPATHKLKATDTLYSLAHEYYGTYGPWRLIRDANGIPKRFGAKTKIVTLPGHFKVGHKLKIPQVPDPTRTTHKSGGAGL